MCIKVGPCSTQAFLPLLMYQTCRPMLKTFLLCSAEPLPWIVIFFYFFLFLPRGGSCCQGASLSALPVHASSFLDTSPQLLRDDVDGQCLVNNVDGCEKFGRHEGIKGIYNRRNNSVVMGFFEQDK